MAAKKSTKKDSKSKKPTTKKESKPKKEKSLEDKL